MTELSEAREELLFYGAMQASRLRIPFEDSARVISNYVSRLPASLDGSRFLPISKHKGGKKIHTLVHASFKDAQARMEGSIRRVMIRAARSQKKYLRANGFSPPTEEEIELVAQDLLRKIREEFPRGTGLSTVDRLGRARTLHLEQTKKLLAKTYRDSSDRRGRFAREVKAGLAYSKPGRAPVAGGSATKRVQRLLVAEEMRLANLMEIGVVKMSGVNLSYWRLNGRHQWQGGKEICEIHATHTGEGVLKELKKKGVPPGEAPIEGLHLVSRWPDYPHPFCGCYPEPFLL